MGMIINPSRFGIGDPNWADVSALLHFDGADASTVFTDETGKTWTANGSAQIDTAQSKFGGASGLFDSASGDSISTPASSDFTFGTDPFAIEFFLRVSALPVTTQTIVSNIDNSVDNDSIRVVLLSTGKLRVTTWGLEITPAATNTLPINTQVHVAATFDGTTYRLFMGGVPEASGTVVRNLSAINALYIGRNEYSDAPQYFSGHVDELRITKGVARYTSAFTPPTQAFPNS